MCSLEGQFVMFIQCQTRVLMVYAGINEMQNEVIHFDCCYAPILSLD